MSLKRDTCCPHRRYLSLVRPTSENGDKEINKRYNGHFLLNPTRIRSILLPPLSFISRTNKQKSHASLTTGHSSIVFFSHVKNDLQKIIIFIDNAWSYHRYSLISFHGYCSHCLLPTTLVTHFTRLELEGGGCFV